LTPADEPQKSNTLVYILRIPVASSGRELESVQRGSEWQAVQKASESNGKIVEKVDSTFMALTDFSPSLR